MKKRVTKFVYWTPRILSILFIAFLALMSLDVFDSNPGFWEAVLGLFMHNIPVFILIAVLWISWKHEIVGAIAFMLADMEVMIETSRLLIWRSAKAYENGLKEASKLSAMAKLYASDSAMKIATDAVQIMGGDGYTHEFMVEKIMRDVKLTQIYEGTNQVQRVVISKSILKG